MEDAQFHPGDKVEIDFKRILRHGRIVGPAFEYRNSSLLQGVPMLMYPVEIEGGGFWGTEECDNVEVRRICVLGIFLRKCDE